VNLAPLNGSLGRGARVGRAFWDIPTALVTHPYIRLICAGRVAGVISAEACIRAVCVSASTDESEWSRWEASCSWRI
jgi:hypothetical protein